jgi:cellulose biosynthesis protein BcsQ
MFMQTSVQVFYDLYFKSPGWVQAFLLITLLILAGISLGYQFRNWYKIKAVKVDRDALRVQVRDRDLSVRELETKAASLQSAYEKQKSEIGGLNEQSGRLSEQLQQARSDVEKTQNQLVERQQELNDLGRRFEALQTVDANVWISSIGDGGPAPAFVPRTGRKTRFVTFLNLKGGVGKTTLVANLGAAYAVGAAGNRLRVLMIDLDYQGTLSNLCVSEQFLSDRRNPNNRNTSDALLADEGQPRTAEQLLAVLTVPVEGTEGRGKVIVADEHLDHIDFRQQARFAVERRELRFLHRKILHQPYVFQNFDLVLFDCPPRLTTSTVNALAASDFLVLPTGLHPNDVDAVPRTLRWLEKLQALDAFQARLVAVILNRTFRKGTVQDLTKDEKLLKNKLEALISPFVLTGGAVLDNVVGNSPDVARTMNRVPLGATPEGLALYSDVAKELYVRIAR